MDKKAALITVGVISLGLIIGGTIWYRSNKKKNQSPSGGDTTTPDSTGGNNDTTSTSNTSNSGAVKTPTASLSPIQLVAKNLGGGGKVGADGNVTIDFNSGKNTITFFSNNRYGVSNKATKALVSKGSWSKGGTALKPDGGFDITTKSIWKTIGLIKV